MGANRRYVDEAIPHIGLGSVIDQSDALVVGRRADRVISELRARSRADHFILDLVGLPPGTDLKG
jgi:hypothetical protein